MKIITVKVLIAMVSMLMTHKINGQPDKFSTIDLHPVSPSAFQFIKYTELPVSQYTGIPSISIPLYQINEDDVSVPISLSYHSVGIRVSQEASMVGLGWDLTFGSVVQTINDRDDYGVTDPGGVPFVRRLPDYHFVGGAPNTFPKRFKYPCLGGQGTGWSSPISVPSVDPLHTWKIATDYYVPVNGQFDVQETGMFTYENYDSEPDVFTANFLGHSFKFVRMPSPDRLVVLDKKGYAVTRIDSSWKIITPSGDEFYFNERSKIKSQSYSQSITGPSSVPYETSSIIWMLTKIVTKHKKEIRFYYHRTTETEGFPSYSDKLQIFTDTTTIQSSYNGIIACVEDYYIGDAASNHGGGLFASYSISKEQYLYPDSIVFPRGKIDFNFSARNDMTSAKKLDKIQVRSPSQTVNVFNFNYGYFDSTSSSGICFAASFGIQTGSVASQRLKLLSITDSSGAEHLFAYNNTPLPRKNSFAQDFWGFYNGADTNTSLVPNPVLFGHPQMGDYSNDRSARLSYAKAGILEQIQYPTGGKVVFEYELNQFSNYWVPDSNSTSNTISNGNGLRVKSITHFADLNKRASKTKYSYAGGRAIHPIQMFRAFSHTSMRFQHPYFVQDSYSVEEMSANGVYTSSPFGSINGIAYDTVTMEDVNESGATMGKTVTYYHNNTDLVNTSASGAYIYASLPAIEPATYPENGSVKKMEIYNHQNVLLKKVINNYLNIVSSIYYGARIFPYFSLYFSNGDTETYGLKLQNLIGYYPIFDFESLLTSSVETEYAHGDSLVKTKTNTYDELNRLVSVTNSNSNSEEKITFSYPSYGSGTGIFSELFQRNRLMDVISYRKYWLQGFSSKAIEGYTVDYRTVHDKIMKDSVKIIDPYPYDVVLYKTSYDIYDTIRGNLRQYTEKDVTKSFIWDYNYQYVTAEIINAKIESVFYTSFEDVNKGGWSFSGSITSDATSPTGNKCYSLSGGDLTTPYSPYDPTKIIISFWAKGGTHSVNGSSTPTRTGKTINGWTYYEYELLTDHGTISGSSYIDEVRMYPRTSRMTTYTYAPLIGMTSQCDDAGRITYFEYDTFNRLRLIKDENERILKRIDYKYQGTFQQ